jgi:salicylate hydroxylase
VQNHRDLEAALMTFDSSRRERTQWLVQSSRFIGDCYEWRADGVGNDLKKIEEAINHRNSIITDADVEKMCRDAKEDLAEALAGQGRASL